MRVFSCGNCGQLVFFPNTECLCCHAPLGYVHADRSVVALNPIGGGVLTDLRWPAHRWRYCATANLTRCNWLVPAETGKFCESCRLTRTRPADNDPEGLEELARAEAAKRRLLFQLAEIGLPVQGRQEGGAGGLAFDLLSSREIKVITGHDHGLITLDLAEADDEHRERLRQQLAEPYRTVLGHFRHEIGHFYWPILVREPDVLAACRSLFGDDRADYAHAIHHHYQPEGDQGDAWLADHVSRYAAMHPFEDWAETFAHYLHMLDTLQSAESFGIMPRAGSGGSVGDATRPDGSATFGELVDHWLALTYGLNQINQSMGRDDLYPFVLAPTVIRKLAFVDRAVRNRRD